jgi:hypothetical protein
MLKAQITPCQKKKRGGEEERNAYWRNSKTWPAAEGAHMKQLKADATLEDRVEKLLRRLQRINPRKNDADAKAAIRSAFAHLLGSLAFRDDEHRVPSFPPMRNRRDASTMGSDRR